MYFHLLHTDSSFCSCLQRLPFISCLLFLLHDFRVSLLSLRCRQAILFPFPFESFLSLLQVLLSGKFTLISTGHRETFGPHSKEGTRTPKASYTVKKLLLFPFKQYCLYILALEKKLSQTRLLTTQCCFVSVYIMRKNMLLKSVTLSGAV